METTQLKITICPNCGSDKIRQVKRDWVDEIRGETFIVPNLEFYECPTCGEKLYDREAMRLIEAHTPRSMPKSRKRTQQSNATPLVSEAMPT